MTIDITADANGVMKFHDWETSSYIMHEQKLITGKEIKVLHYFNYKENVLN